ncbi:TonB-dependent receptor [Sulfurovum sp.]|uniref:TonB-dependent receptor n=1 Tax=Sulfurovum sp. TaxID=1969726 RepID=UPI002867B420|nr:TonB-dependent receptor [Sulfurovum sp.]
MKKVICLSLACTLWIYAAEVKLETINVETSVDSEVIKDVSGEDIKSADLGEALFKQSASVSLVRRSGIANDIILRGQKKDNINVTIDGAKIYGACPNRMDPPVSHVLTNNIDYIEINEGPFNVEDFGVLSADVKIHTIKPEEEFHGDVNLGFGSWGYKKASMSASGAITENVKFLLSASTETSGQYEDGDGNTFADQVDNYITDNLITNPTNDMQKMFNKKLSGAAYQDEYRDMDAYTKKTVLAKLFWNITDNQEVRLSYTGNRSDDVLYPSSPMDALYDDSDIFNVEYIAKDIGEYSKELKVQVYQSEVEHPMSTKYRKSGAVDYMTHALTTKMQGANIKNSFDVDNHIITVGLDYSLRNWDGVYTKNDIPLNEFSPMTSSLPYHSIYDVDTENMAFFLKDKIKMDKLVLDLGLRYDDTAITSAYQNQQDNDYNELNGYIFATYNADANTQYFAGLGKSSRVPDAKELYWLGSMGNLVGTPNLEATVNYEFDIGLEKKFDNATVKAKAFYSQLDNFIAYNSSNLNMMGAPVNAYENVDASIYGFELSGSYIATAQLAFDYGIAYQRGEKDTPLLGQTGTNMPEIPPFKFNAAVNYDHDETLAFKAELVASDAWTYFDVENGEQELDAYGIVNLKGTKQWGAFELTVGVDNLFDKTYAVSNTYNDLILLPTAGNNYVMLMNEPGRYLYTNLQYKF